MTTYYFVVDKKHFLNNDERSEFERNLERKFKSYLDMCEYAYAYGVGKVDILTSGRLEHWQNNLDLLASNFIYVVSVND